MSSEVAKKYIEMAIESSSKAVAMHSKYYEKTRKFLDTSLKLRDCKDFRKNILDECCKLFCIKHNYSEWFRSMSRIFNHKIPEQVMSKNIPELQELCELELIKI